MKDIKILDILLVIIIIYVIYLWYKNSRIKAESNQNENFCIGNKKSKKISALHDRTNNTTKKYDFNDIFDSQSSEINLNMFDQDIKNKNTKLLKPYFMEMQFHTDYRDTITAFNDIAPSQKEIFNCSDLPTITSYPSHEEVYYLIKEFIKQLNKDIKYNVSDYRTSNTGWDEPIPDLKQKSGWDKQQDELDLPSSLYSDPAKKSPVRLIKIDQVEKNTTESETKYICTIIIQKINVEDQMIIKISFVKDNSNINGERQFFKDLENNYMNPNNEESSDLNIIIEEIFVVGFLTDEGTHPGNKTNDFYNFKGLLTDDIIDNKTIMRELIKKYKNRSKDDLKFTSSLDEQGRIFHDELRDISSYESFKCTRSIYDDLNGKSIIYE